ncbi:MAG TPA: hypothetical protein VGM86_30980 [Thermoanaerobaculia bacterium]
MTPTADGGAYIATLDAGLWYVRGVEAVRVHFNDPGSQNRDSAKLDLLEITPTVDGSAYAISPSNEGLWYLKEGQAYRVSESAGIRAQAYKSSGDKFFSLYIAELKKRRSASEDFGSTDTDDSEHEQ